MAGFALDLPTLQNWSCHSCSGCCRQHGIAITEDEQRRIAAQGWTPADGISAGQPLFVRMGRWPGKRWWRLAHQPDGRCVFLDDQGLCRIHARFGEPAKPLACRIYPYAFHPAGKKVVVSLRFSCPSVVRNQGRSVAAQSRDLRDLSRQVVPENVTRARPPLLKPGVRLEWEDILRIVAALESAFAAGSAPVAVRLLRNLQLIDLLEKCKLDTIRGERLTELLGLLGAAAEGDVPDDLDLGALPPPSRLGRMQFRLLCGHYARKDSYGTIDRSLSGRLHLFRAALKLARGSGMLPRLQASFPAAPFESLERPCGPLSPEAEEILGRYYRIKLRGLHFCGAAYYHRPLIEGFRSLALVYPAVLWIARWLAAAGGRERPTTDDVAAALAQVDHHHGYSPALGGFTARSRVKTLATLGDISRLCAWYAR